MAGGLMQLVSQGQANLILNGNPQKSFWKATYKHYTNYGKQNFLIFSRNFFYPALGSDNIHNEFLDNCHISIWKPCGCT